MSIAELEGAYGGPESSGSQGLVPPQDVDAERSVLGGMLLSKDAIADAAETVSGTDFYRPAHEQIYEAIIELYGRGEPADAITVADELGKRGELQRIGGQAYLHELIQSVPTAANAGFYASIVAERAVLRRLVQAGTRITQMGYADGAGDVVDVINAAQAEIFGVTAGKEAEDYVRIGDVIEATADEIDAASGTAGQMTGVPTGFTDMDALTNGLHPGQMIVVAARPAVGKSTLGLDIARAASIKNDMASVVFSLEMSKTEITMRLLSAEAGIQLQHMRKGTMRDEDWTKLAATMGRVADAPLFIDDSPNMSLMEIRSKCRRLKERNNLKLVIIDYLQLMTSGKRVESRQQEVSEFSRALKLLAKELEVPVIAISQLNRGPEQRNDKRPQMSDLRESGCLTADTLLLRADTGAEVSIGQLAASGEKDVPVWALDDSLRYVARPLTHAFCTGVRPVFRLTLASGKTLRATENHRFMTYDGWKALGDIRTGERLAVPRHVPAPQWSQRSSDDEFEQDNELADEARLAEMAQLWSSRTPFLPRNYRRETRGCTIGVDVVPEKMRELIPDLFFIPKRFIAYFIDRLWRLDGQVDQGTSEQGSIWLAAKSRRLLEGISRLLLRFGIGTRIAAHEDGWRLHIEGVDHQRRFLQEVYCHEDRKPAEQAVLDQVREETDRRDAAPVEEVLRTGMREVVGAQPGADAADGQPLATVVSIFDRAELDVEAINDVQWDSVASVEPEGVEEVFDATVLDCHNFVANGISAHNSIEQDADMVILLHREDSYDKESERAGEADLIVAKHRNGPTDTITVAFQGHYSRFTNMAQNF